MENHQKLSWWGWKIAMQHRRRTVIEHKRRRFSVMRIWFYEEVIITVSNEGYVKNSVKAYVALYAREILRVYSPQVAGTTRSRESESRRLYYIIQRSISQDDFTEYYWTHLYCFEPWQFLPIGLTRSLKSELHVPDFAGDYNARCAPCNLPCS